MKEIGDFYLQKLAEEKEANWGAIGRGLMQAGGAIPGAMRQTGQMIGQGVNAGRDMLGRGVQRMGAGLRQSGQQARSNDHFIRNHQARMHLNDQRGLADFHRQQQNFVNNEMGRSYMNKGPGPGQIPADVGLVNANPNVGATREAMGGFLSRLGSRIMT